MDDIGVVVNGFYHGPYHFGCGDKDKGVIERGDGGYNKDHGIASHGIYYDILFCTCYHNMSTITIINYR